MACMKCTYLSSITGLVYSNIIVHAVATDTPFTLQLLRDAVRKLFNYSLKKKYMSLLDVEMLLKKLSCHDVKSLVEMEDYSQSKKYILVNAAFNVDRKVMSDLRKDIEV